jgi:hypothetical protein
MLLFRDYYLNLEEALVSKNREYLAAQVHLHELMTIMLLQVLPGQGSSKFGNS